MIYYWRYIFCIDAICYILFSTRELHREENGGCRPVLASHSWGREPASPATGCSRDEAEGILAKYMFNKQSGIVEYKVVIVQCILNFLLTRLEAPSGYASTKEKKILKCKGGQ